MAIKSLFFNINNSTSAASLMLALKVVLLMVIFSLFFGCKLNKSDCDNLKHSYIVDELGVSFKIPIYNKIDGEKYNRLVLKHTYINSIDSQLLFDIILHDYRESTYGSPEGVNEKMRIRRIYTESDNSLQKIESLKDTMLIIKDIEIGYLNYKITEAKKTYYFSYLLFIKNGLYLEVFITNNITNKIDYNISDCIFESINLSTPTPCSPRS